MMARIIVAFSVLQGKNLLFRVVPPDGHQKHPLLKLRIIPD
jgi:hypothetical protein